MMKVIDSLPLKALDKSQDILRSSDTTSIFNIPINSLEGKPVDFNEFKGKYMLFVNVASKCGFTRQYKALQELSDKYGNELVVIGLPCNQFGNQEPGTAKEIQDFCDLRFGVSFPLTEKIKVKGSGQHPIYQWLTKKQLNGKKNSKVHWNFQKYLVNPKGELVDIFFSTTSPLSKKITRYFHKKT